MHSIFEKNKVAIDFSDTHRENPLTPKSHCFGAKKWRMGIASRQHPFLVFTSFFDAIILP